MYSVTTILRYIDNIPLRSIDPSKPWWFVNVYISTSLSIGRMFTMVISSTMPLTVRKT